jgi:DNA-binding LytR/AlgR family response regulator
MSYLENQQGRFRENELEYLAHIEKTLLKANLCIYTFFVDNLNKQIVQTFSNCSNKNKIDFKKFITEYLISDLSNRVIVNSITISPSSNITMFISIRNIHSENYFISFTEIKDLAVIDEINIESMKNTIMIHETNLLMKQVYNSISNFNLQFNSLLEFVDNSKKIALPATTGLKLKKTSSIKYCIADGNYTIIHYLDNSKDCISKPLSWFEKRLCNSEEFVKIHKSYIINNIYVSEIKEKHVVMNDGKEFSISVRRKHEFKKHHGII